jgi:hypothetical protein
MMLSIKLVCARIYLRYEQPHQIGLSAQSLRQYLFAGMRVGYGCAYVQAVMDIGEDMTVCFASNFDMMAIIDACFWEN